MDSINKPNDLVNKAIELGLCGIAITDHESLSTHAWISQKQQELIDSGSDFKIGYGNEIYLTDTRDSGQKYYHLILIAKDTVGHKMMRELSSLAWMGSYVDRGMRRVPTLKSELRDVIERYGKGHLICTSACLGGELSTKLLEMILAEESGNEIVRTSSRKDICAFVKMMKELFEDDFYFEVAPGLSEEQIKVNKRMPSLANAFKLKIVCGSDAHFLNKIAIEQLLKQSNLLDGVQCAFLDGLIQSDNEIREHLSGLVDVDDVIATSQEIYDKIQPFSLFHKQQVTQVEVQHFDKREVKSKYPTLDYLYGSDDPQDRYWVNYCVNKLKEKGLCNSTYLSRLEEEADTQKHIGEALETNIFAYPIFLQHYIDMFWECGSTVGAGRGSSCAGLNHWLLGVTQLDPILHNLPYFRFLNKDRQELPKRNDIGQL